MASAKSLLKKYQIYHELKMGANIDKEKHMGFFLHCMRDLLTKGSTENGWEAIKLLGKSVEKTTGIKIVFYDNYATAKSYCQTFNSTFGNDSHISHLEMLEQIEEKMAQIRNTNYNGKYVLHLWNQVKQCHTINNLKLSRVILYDEQFESEEMVDLHVLAQGMITPVKEIDGQIGFNVDCNGKAMQTRSSMISYFVYTTISNYKIICLK